MPLYRKSTGSGSGSVATDTVFDAKGDLAVGTGADTAAKLTVGSDYQTLIADASASTGLKWKNPLFLDAADYGASSSASASANVTAIQAALDAAGGKTVMLPTGTLSFNATLKLNAEQRLVGHTVLGSAGSGSTILSYTGADATNGIEMKTPASGPSRVWLEGFRLIDARSSPTSGDGIHLANVKNAVIIKNVGSFFSAQSSAGYGIYAGATTTTEVVHIEDVWVAGGLYGVFVENIDNTCRIVNVSGDALTSGSATMAALINVANVTAGNGCVVVDTAKCETTNGCHVLRVASTVSGVVVASNLIMRGGGATGSGGDVINYNSTSGYLFAFGLSAQSSGSGVTVADSLVNDVGASQSYGVNKRMMTSFSLSKSNHSPAHHIGSQAFGSSALAATTTLDASHGPALLVTTGSSNRTMNLPAASTAPGWRYEVKKVDSGTGTVILDPNSSETIDGATTYTLLNQYESVVVQCDGTAWHVLSRNGTFFEKTATVVNSNGVAAQNVVVWRAPYACTVRAVKGYRVGGSGATVNAGKGTTATPTNKLMSSDLSLTSAEAWTDAGTIQNASFAVDDPLIAIVASVAGSPTEVGIQVEFSRP